MELHPQTDAGLLDACGVEPAWLCERVYEWTDNDALAGAATWVVDRPVKVLVIIVLALFVRRLAHRGIDALVERLVSDRRAEEEAATEEAKASGDRWSREVLAAKLASLHDRSERSRIRPLPPPFLAIFLTGQPMLMSIKKAPAPSARLAASAMACGR